MAEWVWVEDEDQYYDAEDREWLAWAAVLALLYLRIDYSLPIVDRLALILALEELPLSGWESQMRRLLMEDYIQAYLLGRGGLGQMTMADWAMMSDLLSGQYGYLRDLAQAIEEGLLSEAQIAYRSRLFINSQKQAYWRGRGSAAGWPELPAYPGDCSTICCTGCKCVWRMVKTIDGWDAYWEIRPAEHCGDCVWRADNWNPLVVGA